MKSNSTRDVRVTDGELDDSAQVADLSAHVKLKDWPEHTRFIARRERLHPGAQRSLFGSDLWR